MLRDELPHDSLFQPPSAGDTACLIGCRSGADVGIQPACRSHDEFDRDRSLVPRIRRYQREIRNGTGYPFFIFSPDEETLLGGLTLAQIQRGVTQSAVLGYWMGARHAGKGLMAASVRAVIGFAFDTLHLNRIEAACLPHNAASTGLLEKVGFTREGYARKYLCIDGRWQDHVLYGLIRDDPRR